ncbi:minor structural protein 6 [Weissella oryzae SG25]|uniref:Minor structural protein 6 n=1 Tax=Weissella oryzae (strain DSM 25784 / JCM 18191 / LMG 30913 / SG25) TaxID=1329250 RepID=A0A069CVV8_WEIOS|nr:DUF3801 domain-containing protein [Weissella oryzae]GAK31338.1 minor structural protein 6 [Weissella oryzae SG25]
MEQKEVIHKITTSSDMTIRALYQLMEQFELWLHDSVKNHINTTMLGEQPLYKLLNNGSGPLTSQQVNQSVDLDKLKEYLNEQGLAFAFKANKDGSHNLFFKVQDKGLAFKALENVKNDMISNPTTFTQKIAKDPAKITFADKVENALKSQKEITNQLASKQFEVGQKGVAK